jgi:putative phosphoesterase
LKIAVISDIHSNLDAFEAVVSSLPSIDALICLGDIVGYGPQPSEVVQRLRRLRPVAVISGNHDFATSTGQTEGFSSNAAEAIEWTRKHINHETLEYLSSLQPSSHMLLNRITVGLFHGSPRDPLGEYVYPDLSETETYALLKQSNSKLLMLGHTHVPMLYPLKRGTITNPGSVGQPRDGDPRASFAIISISDSDVSVEIKRLKYDVDSVAQKIVDAGLPKFLAERLYTGT